MTSQAASPIEEFTQCHAGIVAQLDELARLPALLEAAAQARRIAGECASFFNTVVREHHAEEERDLFPAALASAAAGEERTALQDMVDRLTREHRQIEARWAVIEPALAAAAKGRRDTGLDHAAVMGLVRDYEAHARYEERRFLPLAREILARDGNQEAALRIALHVRREMPQLMEHVGFHV